MNKKCASKPEIVRILVLSILFVYALAGPANAQDDALPLSESGPYAVGTRDMTIIDENRDAREIDVTLWYPAEEEAEDAAPDLSGAPYPLILYSHGHGGNRRELRYLTSHLASHGFVVAAMDHEGDTDFPPLDSVDRPLDVLFVLDRLASLPIGDLTGVIDSDHTGVTGYSEGGFTALQLTGAQRDPAYIVEWCERFPTAYPRVCIPQQFRDQIAAYRSLFEPPLIAGEPWPSFTDERIRAALPITGGPGPLFGERGLASATVPTLLLAGTADDIAPYEWAGVFVYEHLGSSDRYLISVIGADHLFGYTSAFRFRPIVLHFATAFFGYYLQGREDYAQYLTEGYVNSIEGLAWGPYGVELSAQGAEPITPENADRVTQVAALEQGSPVHSVAFSPDGAILAAGSGNGWEPGSVYLWDVATGTERAVLNGHTAWVRSVAFNPDGTVLASGSGDRTVRLWDTATGDLLLVIGELSDAVPGTITCTEDNGRVTRHQVFSDAVWSVAFSPDGVTLATGRGDPWVGPGSFQLYNVVTGEMPADVEPRHSHGTTTVSVYGLAFSPDGTLLATANGGGTVRLWDAVTGQERAILGEHTGWVGSLAFSSNGAVLASGGVWSLCDYGTVCRSEDEHGEIRLWDVLTGEQIVLLEGHTGGVSSVAFSSDGRVVASGGDFDGTIWLWDVTTQTALAVLEGHSVSSLAFSADGTTLATGGRDGMVRLWGLPTR